MATWSLLISFIVTFCAGLVMDELEVDEDGNVVVKSHKFLRIWLSIVRYFAMLLLYGGMVTVVVGLFVMTPETANGRGSVPVVSDAVNSTPIGEAPPGPDSVAETGAAAGDKVGGVAK